MTPTQTLAVLEAIHDRCDLSGNAEYVSAVTTVPFVFPTIERFNMKANYWQFVNSYSTQKQIETTLLQAIWIDDITRRIATGEMEDEREDDSPLIQRVYQLTLFTESKFDRYDENASLNTFERKCNKRHLFHNFTRDALDLQFKGSNPLGLDESIFATAETVSLTELDFTQREVNCEFIGDPSVFGSVTKFECVAKVELVAC